MRHSHVETPEQALLYLTECSLATVEHMSMLKSKSKSEYGRQILIAQRACDWLDKFGIDPKGTRAEDIIGKCQVEDWAKSLYQ